MSKRYDLSNLAFLLIDDNNYMRSIVKALLRGYGAHRVSEAVDAAEAFEEFRNTQIDVIIVDYALDTLDGVEFVHLVRTANDSPNPYVPIIMLTAHSERIRVEQARDAGITEFLRKPVCAETLYRRIVEVVERPRPFIRTKNYFGPDRRRRADRNYSGPERRKENLRNAEAVEVDTDAPAPTPA
jgi:CheY-like chemotaxis protein